MSPVLALRDVSLRCQCLYAIGGLCCKSLFALVIKNFRGCRRSPDDKLTGDFGNVIEAAQIGVRRSDRLTTRKTSQANFGVLQQY